MRCWEIGNNTVNGVECRVDSGDRSVDDVLEEKVLEGGGLLAGLASGQPINVLVNLSGVAEEGEGLEVAWEKEVFVAGNRKRR